MIRNGVPTSGFVIVCAAAVVLSAGCGSSNDRQASDAGTPAESLHTEMKRGPVSVELDIVPKEPRLSDEPVLTVTITADKGVDVTAPPFGESLGDFVIRDFHEPLPTSADGRQIIQQIYTLEALQAGAVTVAPMVVTFTDNRPDGEEMNTGSKQKPFGCRSRR